MNKTFMEGIAPELRAALSGYLLLSPCDMKQLEGARCALSLMFDTLRAVVHGNEELHLDPDSCSALLNIVDNALDGLINVSARTVDEVLEEGNHDK